MKRGGGVRGLHLRRGKKSQRFLLFSFTDLCVLCSALSFPLTFRPVSSFSESCLSRGGDEGGHTQILREMANGQKKKI